MKRSVQLLFLLLLLAAPGYSQDGRPPTTRTQALLKAGLAKVLPLPAAAGQFSLSGLAARPAAAPVVTNTNSYVAINSGLQIINPYQYSVTSPNTIATALFNIGAGNASLGTLYAYNSNYTAFVTLPANGSTLTYNFVTYPNLVFQPATNITGTYSFPFALIDNTGAQSNTGTYAITIGGPSAKVQTSQIMLSSFGATTLSLPLVGAVDPAFGATRTVNNFVIRSLPTAAQGVLALGGSPVSVGQVIPAASAASLTFDPAAGFFGTAVFTYSARDNANLVGAPAGYGIPVSNQSCNTANGPVSAVDFTTRTIGEDFVQANKTISVDGVTITFNPTGYPYQNAAASLSSLTVQDYVGLPGKGLVWQEDYTSGSTKSSSFTMAFSRPIANFTFTLGDMDRNFTTAANSEYIDRLLVSGYDASGNLVTLAATNVSTGSSTTYVGNNQVLAIQNTGGDPADNVTITVPQAISRITLSYENQSTNADVGFQFVSIPQMAWCTPVADVVTTIAPAATPVNGGAQGQFNVTFTNSGPNAASGVMRQVQLPTGLSNVVATGGGVYDATTGLVNYPDTDLLASGSNLNSTITFTTPASGSVAASSSISTTSNEGGATGNNTASSSITLTAVANVATTITAPASITAGQTNVPVTVTFANVGGASAANATRTVSLPAGVLSVTASGGVITGTAATGFTVTYPAVTTLAAGATATFNLTYNAPLTGNVTVTSNTSTTTSEGGLTANNSASATSYAAPADVTTALTGPSTVSPGQPTGNYTVTFTNEGPNAALNVSQQVTLPAGVTAVVLPTGATQTGNVINFGTALNLASGASNSFVFSFTPATTATGTLNLTSNVTATGSQGANTAPDASTLALTVAPTANVSATLTRSAATAAGGSTASFTATFANSGPATAADVVATVQLPQNLTNVTATNGGVYSPVTGLVTYFGLTSLASGASSASTITFDVPQAGPVAATAAVSTSTNEAGQTANNQAASSIDVTPTFDLATTLSGPAAAAAGNPVTLTVTTTNNGPGTTNAVQTLQLATGLTNVYVSNGGVYNPATTTQTIVSNGVSYSVPAGGVVFPTLTNLPTGQTVTNTVSYNQPATAFSPTAQVTPNTTGTGDTNTANNSANLNGAATATNLTVSPAGTGSANAYTVISTSAASTTVGSPITLTVVTGNRGPVQATGVTQRVQLLPGLATAGLQVNGSTATTTSGNIITFTASGAQYDNATGMLTFPTLTDGANGSASGSSVSNTITYNAPATVGSNGQQLATATVSTTNADPVPADNVSAVGVTLVPRTDVSTLIAGPLTATAGQQVVYEATFSNNGPMAAANVTETVQLPTGLSTVTVTDAAGNTVTASYNSTTGQLVLPTAASLAAGASQVYRISFAAVGSSMTVRSNVASGTVDAVTTNNSAVVLATVLAAADLTTSVRGPATAVVGNPVTFAVSTTNNGPSAATTTKTTLQLPAGFNSTTLQVNGLTGTASGGALVFSDGSSYDQSTGLLTFGSVASLASGASVANYATFLMPSAPANGQVIGTSTASSAVTDPVSNNNAASVATSVAPTTTTTADLTATVSAGTVAANGNVTLTATFANATGGGTATNVRPTLQLAPGQTVATIQVAGQAGTLSGNVITFPNGATYNTSTGLVVFPVLATQASGASTAYAVLVKAPSSGSLTAVANTTSDTSEPNTAAAQANNTQAVTVTAPVSFDVTTSLSGPTAALAGSTNYYTVTTTNNGPSATDAAATQTVSVPAGVTPANITNGGMYSSAANTITWAIAAGQASGSAVANSFSLVLPAAGASFTATVSATGDSNTGNNTAALTTTPANQPPLAYAVVNNQQGTATSNNPMGNSVASNPATPTGLLISPLVASDPEAALSSTVPFTITSLPTAGQGTLYYDNGGTYAPVAANQTLSAAQAASLRFLPNSSFVGNASFTYLATDAAGNPSPVVSYTIPVAADQNTTYTKYNSNKGLASNKYLTNDILAQAIDPNTAQYTSAGLIYDATTGALLSGAANGLPTSGTNAVLVSGMLPSGVSLDPATGRIYVSNAALLPQSRAAQNFTVSIRTTDVNGGTNTVPVTFTIGAYPLPVELAVFTAVAKSLDAQLAWTTASEKDNDHFEVERSLNGTDFVKIAEVKGQGNSTRATDYTRTDAGIGAKANGLVYYRLKQVDGDGTSSFSPVRTVRFGNVVPAITVYPNPATTATSLDLTLLPTGAYRVSVLDAAGREVLNTTLEAGLTHALELNTIASGSYTLLVRGENGGQVVNLTKRLIKE